MKNLIQKTILAVVIIVTIIFIVSAYNTMVETENLCKLTLGN